MAAIADQGRVLNGAAPLGSTQTLTDLYHLENIAPGDFHDITQGNNGFSAGPGYDLVTGIGSPQANLLIPDLSAYGLASDVTIATEPPPTVVQGDSFGMIAEPTDPLGQIDPTYTGTATLSLLSGPAGATFTPLTVSIVGGMVVFSDLSLNTVSDGTDYVFQVSMNGLSSATTDPVDVVAPTAGVSNYYPLPFENSIRGAVLSADFDGSSTSVITLSVSILNYDISAGELPLFNGASGNKTICDRRPGHGRTRSSTPEGTTRVFEIIGGSSLSVVFQSLGIEGGDATDGGFLGLDAAVGGGVLIDGGQVAMSNIALMNNEAAGFSGPNGSNGHSATKSNRTGGAGGAGGAGGNAQGGSMYLYAGSLTLTNDVIQGNIAQGGAGGAGGAGGNGYSTIEVTTPSGSTHSSRAACRLPPVAATARRRQRGHGQGGSLYIAGGTLSLKNDTDIDNIANGGAGGVGGKGGNGGYWTFAAGDGGNGATGGNGCGGALYLAGGVASIIGSLLNGNTAARRGRPRRTGRHRRRRLRLLIARRLEREGHERLRSSDWGSNGGTGQKGPPGGNGGNGAPVRAAMVPAAQFIS